jgi:hypothetical protein
MAYLGQRARTAEQACAALGAMVTEHGVKYRCVDHNDLGVLYWQPYGPNGKPKGALIYDRHLDYLAGFPGAY